MNATADPDEGKSKDEADGTSPDAKPADGKLPETPEEMVEKEVDVRTVSLGQLAPKEMSGSPAGEEKNLSMLLDIPIPVTVEVGSSKMLLQELLSLQPGSVIPLEKKVGEPVNVVVNGRKVALGEMVSVEEQLGVRITRVLGSVTP